MNLSSNKRSLQIAIQIIGWGMLFVLPLFLAPSGMQFSLMRYINFTFVPISFMIVFYLNYLFLIDRYLIQQKRTLWLILCNIALILSLTTILHYVHVLFWDTTDKLSENHGKEPQIFFVFRDIVSMSLTAGLAVAVKMTSNWYSTEYDRQELERAKSEAELNNLKSQLNPHFLFNTLNNIYSLVNINTDKAQEAIHDLSHLLRYVLYENNQKLVPLNKEVKFVKSYIELMSMRLGSNFHSQVNLPDESTVQVAPMLLITLIENAFKHGVSNTKDCFIHVDFTVDEQQQLHFTVVNSNYAKLTNTEPSGIGLDNMKKRLELLYPNRYKLRLEDLGQTYVARLSIKLTPNEY